jgi:tryptophan synthase beta subunit
MGCGGCAGIGGGANHLKLWSPSIKRSVNSLIIHGAVGAEIRIEAQLLSLINGAIQNVIKGKKRQPLKVIIKK